MIRMEFFSGRTRQRVATINPSSLGVSEIRVTEGLQGTGGGSVIVEYNSSTDSLLDSITKNSHFIVFVDDTTGEIIGSGVTESCFEAENPEHNGALRTINYYSFWDYLGEIIVYSSYKSGQFGANVRVGEDDTTWEKDIYAVNTMRLVGEIFRELSSNMSDHGVSPFWRITDYGSDGSFLEGNEFLKSYTLNSLDFTDVQSIVNDLLDDADCDPMYVDPVISGGELVYEISFTESRLSTGVDLEIDPVGELEFVDHQPSTSFRSFAKSSSGDVDYVSNVSYDGESAYSVYSPDESTLSARGSVLDSANRRVVENEQGIAGQLKYKTTEVAFARVGYQYVITNSAGLSITAVCVERQFDSTTGIFTAELTIVSTEAHTARFRDPRTTSPLGRTIYTPLSRSYKNSRRAIMGDRRRKTTGWRGR